MTRSPRSSTQSPRGSAATTAIALALALSLTAAPRPAAAAKPSTPTAGLRVLELAVEARGADLILPATGVGRLSLAPCLNCRPLALLTGATTRSLVDGAPVTLEVLRRTLLAEPEASVALFYRRSSGEVTRILVTLPAASRRR
jgi:hypothetical protein